MLLWLHLINLKSDDYNKRKRAIIKLGKFDDKRAVDALIGVVKNDRGLYDYALESLISIGDKSLAPLIGLLECKSELINMEIIVEALGKIGNKNAIEPLIKLLNSNCNSIIRYRTVEAIDKIGWTPPKIANAVYYWIIKFSLYKFRTISINHNEGFNRIIEIGEPAIEQLRNILKSDKEERIRLDAVKILAKIKTLSAINSLVDAHGDESFEVYKAASDALVEIGSSCVDILIDKINSEKSTKTRDNLVRTLGDIKDARVNSALIDIVRNDADTGIRTRAIERLGYLKETKAVKPIIEHIEKLKESVTLLSHVPIRALGMIGDPSAIDILIDLFRSNRSSYSQVDFLKNIAVALEKLGWKPETNSTDMAFFVMAIGKGGLKQTIEKLIAIGKKATEPLVLIRDYLATLEPEDTSHGGLTLGQVYGYDNTTLFKMIESYLSD